MDINVVHKEKKLRLIARLKRKILFLFRLSNHPVVKVYNSYGSAEKIIVIGHVLKLSPLPRKTYRKNFINNTIAMLRLFMVRPFTNGTVKMQWQDVTYETHVEDDGFYKFEFTPKQAIEAGWHKVQAHFFHPKYQPYIPSGTGEIFIPYPYQHTFISDIDDTFLISHSSRLRKRLYVLLTKNARSRIPFEGVVNHYQLLATAGALQNTFNPFFFVSSSEWNLYDYIVEFARNSKLPKGVYLLNQLKLFHQVWKTGQTKHATKFMRIARIIETYPDQKYILLGDDSQQDPNIYSGVVEHFPNKIFAVYLRHVRRSRKESVTKIVEKIKAMGVHCCYFHHSSEAVTHSQEIGLIAK